MTPPWRCCRSSPTVFRSHAVILNIFAAPSSGLAQLPGGARRPMLRPVAAGTRRFGWRNLRHLDLADMVAALDQARGVCERHIPRNRRGVASRQPAEALGALPL